MKTRKLPSCRNIHLKSPFVGVFLSVPEEKDDYISQALINGESNWLKSAEKIFIVYCAAWYTFHNWIFPLPTFFFFFFCLYLEMVFQVVTWTIWGKYWVSWVSSMHTGAIHDIKLWFVFLLLFSLLLSKGLRKNLEGWKCQLRLSTYHLVLEDSDISPLCLWPSTYPERNSGWNKGMSTPVLWEK